MCKVISILLFLTVAFSSQTIFAQGCEEPAASTGDDSNKPRIIGFIQPQYEFHMTKDADATPEAFNTNSFKFKRARIGVTGNIPYDFSYYMMVEVSPFVSPTQYPYLLDAFVSYRRFEWLSISMGSFKQPFGLEVNTSCSGLHTIERAMVSDQIVNPQRDMGIMIFGGSKEKKFSYKVAIMNGTGIGAKKLDNNNGKDISGRFVFHPLDFLSIGASFRHGYTSANTDTVTRLSIGGDLDLNYNNIRVQAEYIYDDGLSKDKSSGGGGCGGPTLVLGDKSSGFYVMAMYKTYFNLEPIVKYEQFDTGNTNEETYSRITAGINYFFNDKTRLQLNYQYNNEYNKNKDAEYPNDVVALQLQVKF